VDPLVITASGAFVAESLAGIVAGASFVTSGFFDFLVDSAAKPVANDRRDAAKAACHQGERRRRRAGRENRVGLCEVLIVGRVQQQSTHLQRQCQLSTLGILRGDLHGIDLERNGVMFDFIEESGHGGEGSEGVDTAFECQVVVRIPFPLGI